MCPSRASRPASGRKAAATRAVEAGKRAALSVSPPVPRSSLSPWVRSSSRPISIASRPTSSSPRARPLAAGGERRAEAARRRGAACAGTAGRAPTLRRTGGGRYLGRGHGPQRKGANRRFYDSPTPTARFPAQRGAIHRPPFGKTRGGVGLLPRLRVLHRFCLRLRRGIPSPGVRFQCATRYATRLLVLTASCSNSFRRCRRAGAPNARAAA